MAESIDAKLARITARLKAARDECPACEARIERAAIMEFDGEVPRGTADRLAREAHPCGRHP
jgi:uncharacterized protein with PIN domain